MSEDTAAPVAVQQIEFPCEQCGGIMRFLPTAQQVTCIYCGHEMHIPQSGEEIEELDLEAYFQEAGSQEDMVEDTVVSCSACGAETSFSPTVQADKCPFCDSPIVAAPHADTHIRPRSLLPFAVPREQAVKLFGGWLRSLWFAPSALKRSADQATASRLAGMYVPYWTYDADTISHYTGERGDDYWETQTYTTTVNGKRVTRTRQVRRTRWHRVSGVVFNTFDDILVLASEGLPTACAEKLEPWDLENLVPFDEKYLAGFRAERYQVDLKQGFEKACGKMDDAIRAAIRRDIGGDHQRIHSVHTRRQHLTFKHLLLPVWVSAYRYGGKPYRFLVNGRTGEVQGERPWSVWKILLLVFGLAAAGVALYLACS